jgi:hypothetical protein
MIPRISLLRFAAFALACILAPAVMSGDSDSPASNPEAQPAQSADGEIATAALLDPVVVESEVLRGIILRWPTEAGKTYTVQWLTDLTTEEWQNLVTIDGDGSKQSIFDTAGTSSANFYRVLQNP